MTKMNKGVDNDFTGSYNLTMQRTHTYAQTHTNPKEREDYNG